jgi:hypothetical protein
MADWYLPGGKVMTHLRRLLLAALSAVWVSMILACGGGGTKSDKVPNKGESGYIEMGSQDTVWVAINEEAQRELVSFSRAQNEAAVKQMMQQGRVLVCARRTKVSIVDPGIMSTTIRIMEGEHAGRTGIVPNEWVRK